MELKSPYPSEAAILKPAPDLSREIFLIFYIYSLNRPTKVEHRMYLQRSNIVCTFRYEPKFHPLNLNPKIQNGGWSKFERLEEP